MNQRREKERERERERVRTSCEIIREQKRSLPSSRCFPSQPPLLFLSLSLSLQNTVARHRAPLHEPAQQREAPGNVHVCRVRHEAVLELGQVRQRDRLALVLRAAHHGRLLGRGELRQRLFHAADRGPLRQVQGAPGTRLPRRAEADGAAVLHERGVAGVCARQQGVRRRKKGRRGRRGRRGREEEERGTRGEGKKTLFLSFPLALCCCKQAVLSFCLSSDPIRYGIVILQGGRERERDRVGRGGAARAGAQEREGRGLRETFDHSSLFERQRKNSPPPTKKTRNNVFRPPRSQRGPLRRSRPPRRGPAPWRTRQGRRQG